MSDMYATEEEYRDPNEILNDLGARFSEKTSIESADDGRKITYGQFNEECNRLARFLRSHDVKANDRLVMISPNCIEWLIIFYGVLKYGATIAPLYEEYPDKEIRKFLKRISPRFIFCNRDLSKHAPKEGPGELIPFGHWDKHDEEKGDLFSQLRDFSGEPFAQSVADKEDIAVINTTSGTLEEPRCVLRNYESFLCQAPWIIDRWSISEKDVVLEYRAFNWLSPEALTITPSLLSGATVVIAKRFSRTQFFDWLRDHKITISVGVPAVINMLLEAPVHVKREDFPALRFMTSSSAALFPEKQKEFEARYGFPIVQLMGMTEVVWIALNSPERRKTGSVGWPVDITRIRIENGEGNILDPRKEGEIIIQGKNVGQGYLLEGGEIENFAPGGRFHTGDIGYLDEEGFLFVTGRKKNLIIRGGINVSPLQVNGILLKHPSVHEAETIGVPDTIYGEEVVCIVTLKSGYEATKDQLMAHCECRLSNEMRPKEILIVENIPKTDRGKINKSELLAKFF